MVTNVYLLYQLVIYQGHEFFWGNCELQKKKSCAASCAHRETLANWYGIATIFKTGEGDHNFKHFLFFFPQKGQCHTSSLHKRKLPLSILEVTLHVVCILCNNPMAMHKINEKVNPQHFTQGANIIPRQVCIASEATFLYILAWCNSLMIPSKVPDTPMRKAKPLDRPTKHQQHRHYLQPSSWSLSIYSRHHGVCVHQTLPLSLAQIPWQNTFVPPAHFKVNEPTFCSAIKQLGIKLAQARIRVSRCECFLSVS